MIRQQIIDRIKEELQRISVENGYYTELGKNVYEWRDSPLSRDEMPAVVFRDALGYVEPSTFGRIRWVLRVEFGVFGRTPEETRQALADVLKALKVCEEDRFGGLALFIEVQQTEMGIERHDIETGAVILTVNITYEAERWSM